MSAIPSASPARPETAVAAPPWPLASLAATLLLSSLGTSIANVGLPTLARTFDASFQAVQWVVLAYLLAVTALVVSAGRLGDLFGRRRLLMVGIGIFTAASIFCGSVDDLGWLIAARAVQGSGAALMMALSMALVGETVAKERVGSAMGMLGTMSAVGTALGPSLGGVLIDGFGWQSIFMVNAPLGLVALVLAHRFLPRDRATSNQVGFDVVGSVLLTVALIAYALAVTLGRNFGAINVVLLCAALTTLGMFVVAQVKSVAPLVEPALFRDRAIRTGFMTSMLATTVAMTTLVIGPFHLSGALGLGAGATGMAMAAGPVVAALVGVPAGRGVDRWGAGRMVLIGLSAMALGSGALSVVSTAQGVWGYIGPLVVLTAGFATFQAANNTSVLAAAGPALRGVTSGLLNLSRNLGLITGASAMGAVFASASGMDDFTVASSVNVLAGSHAAFGVATALVVAALVTAIAASADKGP